MYTTWIKIDETLPWIELKGEYPTKREAKKAAGEILNSVKVKVVKASEKRARVKSLATGNLYAKP